MRERVCVRVYVCVFIVKRLYVCCSYKTYSSDLVDAGLQILYTGVNISKIPLKRQEITHSYDLLLSTSYMWDMFF